MNYNELLKNYNNESKTFTFELFSEPEFLRIQIAENKLVFYYPNIVDEKSKLTERESIESLEKEIQDMKEIFSESDSELYLKQKQLEKMEKDFSNKYNKERILDKKNSFLFSLKIEKTKNEKENNKKIEQFKNDFYEFLVELIKLKRLDDKVINAGSIVYCLGIPCIVNDVKYECNEKRTYNIRKRLNNLYY